MDIKQIKKCGCWNHGLEDLHRISPTNPDPNQQENCRNVTTLQW